MLAALIPGVNLLNFSDASKREVLYNSFKVAATPPSFPNFIVMKCPACSHEIPADAKFCQFCGNQLVYDAERKKTVPQNHNTATKMLNTVAPDQAGPHLTHDPTTGLPEDMELWEGHYVPQAMYGWWLGGALLTILTLVGLAMWSNGNSQAWWIGLIGLAVYWLFAFALLWYRRAIVHYKLTKLRFFIERGILFKNVERIDIMHLDKTDFTQGPLERLFKVGNLKIESNSSDVPKIVLHGIANLRVVADLIDKARLNERERRGIDIGAGGKSNYEPQPRQNAAEVGSKQE